MIFSRCQIWQLVACVLVCAKFGKFMDAKCGNLRKQSQICCLYRCQTWQLVERVLLCAKFGSSECQQWCSLQIYKLPHLVSKFGTYYKLPYLVSIYFPNLDISTSCHIWHNYISIWHIQGHTSTFGIYLLSKFGTYKLPQLASIY